MRGDFGVDPKTGLLVKQPGSRVNYLPFPVTAGTRITLKNRALRCGIFYYSKEIPGELIHTYTYQPESNWATYRPDRSSPDWDGNERTLEWDGFVRLVFSGAAEEMRAFPAEERGHAKESDAAEQVLQNLVDIRSAEGAATCTATSGAAAEVPAWLEDEVREKAARVLDCREEGDLTLFLLADTHDVVNGIWPETRQSLSEMAGRIKPDGIVHLGDFVDGLLPARYTRSLVQRQLDDLRAISEKLYVCVGNHDWNYFKGNTTRFTETETAKLYLGSKEPRYFADLPDKKLRMIFPDSFDPNRKDRYGFTMKTVRWFAKTLRTTPQGWRILVFSHVTPVSKLHVWSKEIRNGERMIMLLERAERRRPGIVLGWIHGHSHADQVFKERSFPIIGIGCAKLEDFADHKPAGSVTYARERGTALQELWDVLLIHAKGGMDFIRFGAGEDRHIETEANA